MLPPMQAMTPLVVMSLFLPPRVAGVVAGTAHVVMVVADFERVEPMVYFDRVMDQLYSSVES